MPSILRASGKHEEDFILCDGAAIDLKGASGDDTQPKRFDGIAYGGGKMRPSGAGGGDVVVDLAGVTVIEGSRPILHNHDDTRIVGHSDNIQVNASGIAVQGVVSGAGQAADEVIASSRNGFPWKLSIGARMLAKRRIPHGKSIQVNGRTLAGPFILVTKSAIHEISFVAVPGDFSTSVSIAATLSQKDVDMNFQDWLTANGFDADKLEEKQMAFLKASFDNEVALKAEQDSLDEQKKQETIKASLANAAKDKAGEDEQDADPTADLRAARAAEITRLDKMNTICEDFPTLHASAVSEGWDVPTAELAVMKAEMALGPHVQVHGGGKPTPDVLECALCTAGGLEDVEKQYPDKTLQASHDTYGGNVSIRDLLLQAARDNGLTCRGYAGNEKDILRAAFSTTSLPGIFSNTANKFLLAGFNHVESSWRSISAIGSVSDFKQVTKYRLTGDMTYEQLAPTGEIKHAQVDEESFTNQAVTYARMFGITRVDIINDDLSSLSAVPTKIGMGAAHVINNKFWAEFMDNSAFFTGARNNRATGAGSALSITSLTAAELLFLDQVDPDGLPLGIDPAIMLVPNALWVTAGQIHSDLQVRDESSGAGTKKFLTGNPHAGKYNPVKSSFLGNTSITGNSTTAWYLLADPATLATIEVVFLNGKQTPTTDTAEADFNQLGIQMRGYIDFGVNKQEFRAGVANDGA